MSVLPVHTVINCQRYRLIKHGPVFFKRPVQKELLTLAESLIKPLKIEEVKSIDLYVFGGETGHISVSDDNIVDGPTMDYTDYYSFLEALVDVTLQGDYAIASSLPGSHLTSGYICARNYPTI